MTEAPAGKSTKRELLADWPLWGSLLLLAAAQTQCAVAKDPKHGPFIAVADVLAAGLFGLWFLARFEHPLLRSVRVLFFGIFGLVDLPEGQRRLVWPPGVCWVFVALAALSIGRADSPAALKSGTFEVAQFFAYLICVWMLFANVLRRPAAADLAVRVLVGLTGLIVLYGLAQWAALLQGQGDPVRLDSTFGLGELIAGTAIGHKLHLAGASTRSVYGNFLLMALPLTYGVLLAYKAPKVKVALGGLIALGAATIMEGYHFWALVVILLIMAAKAGRRALAATGAAAVVVIALFASGALAPNRHADFVEVVDVWQSGQLDNVDNELLYTEIKKRWIELQAVVNGLGTANSYRNLAMGVGAGGYQLHIGTLYGTVPNLRKIEPDTNCYFSVIAISMGLFGLAAFVTIFWRQLGLAAAARRAADSTWRRGVALGVWGAIAGMLPGNLFSGVLVRGTVITMVFFLALADAINATAPPPQAELGPEPQEAPAPSETV